MEHKHWFRAKFCQQYRLYFRYHRDSRIIVYARVNDEDSKRVYDSATDVYRTFQWMLDSGHLPDDRDQLRGEAWEESARLPRAAGKAIARGA